MRWAGTTLLSPTRKIASSMHSTQSLISKSLCCTRQPQFVPDKTMCYSFLSLFLYALFRCHFVSLFVLMSKFHYFLEPCYVLLVILHLHHSTFCMPPTPIVFWVSLFSFTHVFLHNLSLPFISSFLCPSPYTFFQVYGPCPRACINLRVRCGTQVNSIMGLSTQNTTCTIN